MECVQISKNGKLLRAVWDKDLEKYVDNEILELTPFILHDLPCIIKADAKFSDLISIVEKNVKYVDSLIGNWCEELIEESKLQKVSEIDHKITPKIDSIEFYWSLETCEDEFLNTELAGPVLLFHGIGKPSIMNILDDIPINLSFCKINELKQYPIRIKKEVYLVSYGTGDPPMLGYKHPTLFEIIKSVFYELSWYGGPDKRDEYFNKLNSIIEKERDKYEDKKE